MTIRSVHDAALGVVHLRIDTVILPALVLALVCTLGWILLRRRMMLIPLSAALVCGVLAALNTQIWHTPTLAAALGHPPRGIVTSAVIPGETSGFHARPAAIYTPPFYGTPGDSAPPVLVLLTGQPGHVVDWIDGGHLADTMDTYAESHDGHAPVVVVADALGESDPMGSVDEWGEPTPNPMCMDSRLGNVATYLSVDVPAWIRHTMRVDTDPSAWAIGGYSYGGTCAVQTALTAPGIYPTFLDISGEDEPRRGTREDSITAAFGDGSAESTRRFDQWTPLTLLREKTFPNSSGAFVVGSSDTEFEPQTRELFAAAAADALSVQYSELPGGHSMDVWAPALEREMDWLGTRMGL